MKGSNPVRKQELDPSGKLWIQEVFYTLQGEGPFVGTPAVFVRLAGCNLKCFWCDTDFESSDWHPELSELLEKIKNVRPAHCKLIVLTGGEPFRQNIAPLVSSLLGQGLRVQIETNGTLWVDLPEHENLYIVCSPKTKNLHEKIVPRLSAYKYILRHQESDEGDGLPSFSTQKEKVPTQLARPQGKIEVFIQPCDEDDKKTNRKNLDKATEVAHAHGYRLGLQMHKVIDIP